MVDLDRQVSAAAQAGALVTIGFHLQSLETAALPQFGLANNPRKPLFLSFCLSGPMFHPVPPFAS